MPTSRDSLLADSPPGWPAWSVSLVLHLGLLALAVYWFQPSTVRVAADQPAREVGIALKHFTDDGPQYEDEASSPLATENTLTNENLLDALPAAQEFPSSAAALPRLPTLGPAAKNSDPLGSAREMTTGSKPSKSIGYPATVSLFGIDGTGTRFVYLFDRSISMAGAPLRAAKQQLIASLDALDSVHQFQIVFFNHEPQSWDLTGGQNRIAFATDTNKRQAEKFVRSVTATGGTLRRTALKLALRLRPDVIFFLTDTDDPMTQADLKEAIRRAQRDAIAINTIEYGIGNAANNDNFLVQLAHQTGGQSVYVDTNQLGR